MYGPQDLPGSQFKVIMYVKLCDLKCVDLREGYLFRVLNEVSDRLALHLRSAGIYDGETMHSFRSGCSITLSLVGVPLEDVARHVGWSSVVTADYYLQTGKVMNSDLVATSLAISTAPSPVEGEPLASVVTRSFSDKNDMRNLSLAFP